MEADPFFSLQGRAPYRRQDWVHAYLSENGEYDRELSETLEDLQGTVQMVFDSETEKKVREVERSSLWYPDWNRTPTKRARWTQQPDPITRSTSHTNTGHLENNHDRAKVELNLKPMPLFSGRRAVTYPGAHPTPHSSYTSGSPQSATSSFEMASSTEASSVGRSESPLRIIIPQDLERCSHTKCFSPYTPVPPPRHPARDLNAERHFFPPRRSSLVAQTFIVPKTPQNSPTIGFFPRRSNTQVRPSDSHHDQLRDDQAFVTTLSEVSDLTLQRSKSMAVLGGTPPRAAPNRPKTAGVANKSSAAPYLKMWTPPAYTPTPPQRNQISTSPKRSNAIARKRRSFHQTLTALPKSASASSLSVASSNKTMQGAITGVKHDFDFSFRAASQIPRHDSLAPLAKTPTTPVTPTARACAPQHLRLTIPETASMLQYPVLGPMPSPAKSDQLMLEIEDGLRALQCESPCRTPRPATRYMIPSPSRNSFIWQGDSIKRIASSAHKHLSSTFAGSKHPEPSTTTRNSLQSKLSSSQSWVTIPSVQSFPSHTSQDGHEIIIDPNNLLSGGPVRTHQSHFRAASVWSTSDISDADIPTATTTAETSTSFLPIPTNFAIQPLRANRSRHDLEFQAHPYEGMTAVTLRPARSGLDMRRDLLKAERVLGLFEGLGLDRKLKREGEDKSGNPVKKKMKRERARRESKRRWDDMFEAVSKAFELG